MSQDVEGCYVGIMEKKMETTIMGLYIYIGIMGYILGLCRDNGKEKMETTNYVLYYETTELMNYYDTVLLDYTMTRVIRVIRVIL